MIHRRTFLRNLVGASVLGGVSLLVFKDHDPCTKTIACDACQAFGKCDLPRAKQNPQTLAPTPRPGQTAPPSGDPGTLHQTQRPSSFNQEGERQL